MTVDFAFKHTPAFRVGSLERKGPWKNDNLRAEFSQLTRWAKAQKLGTGHPSGRIHVKTLPASTAASIVFDPEAVAPRVIYHGMVDWLRSRRQDGKVGRVRGVREVYSADPWTQPKAWASAEVQFLVRRT